MKPEIKEKLEKTRELSRALKKELKDNIEAFIIALGSDIFEEFPEVSKLCWDQYTPYFNDGDKCEFGIHQTLIFVSPSTYSEWEEFLYETQYDGYYELSFSRGKPEKLQKLGTRINEFQNFLNEFSHTLQEIFGDGVTVFVEYGKLSPEPLSHG